MQFFSTYHALGRPKSAKAIKNARDNRRGNKKWTIQRNWQQDEDKQNKNTTQYVLDTTMRTQTNTNNVSKT